MNDSDALYGEVLHVCSGLVLLSRCPYQITHVFMTLKSPKIFHNADDSPTSIVTSKDLIPEGDSSFAIL